MLVHQRVLALFSEAKSGGTFVISFGIMFSMTVALKQCTIPAPILNVVTKWIGSLHKIWVNYNDLTATSLGIMVSKGNHPQMALIQVSEIL